MLRFSSTTTLPAPIPSSSSNWATLWRSPIFFSSPLIVTFTIKNRTRPAHLKCDQGIRFQVHPLRGKDSHASLRRLYPDQVQRVTQYGSGSQSALGGHPQLEASYQNARGKSKSFSLHSLARITHNLVHGNCVARVTVLKEACSRGSKGLGCIEKDRRRVDTAHANVVLLDRMNQP